MCVLYYHIIIISCRVICLEISRYYESKISFLQNNTNVSISPATHVIQQLVKIQNNNRANEQISFYEG